MTESRETGRGTRFARLHPLAAAITAAVAGATLLAGCAGMSHKPQSEVDLARAAYMRKDFAKAARILSEPAMKGDPEAQYALGYMYYYGEGVPKDLYRAQSWLETAARLGHRDARRALTLLELHSKLPRGSSAQGGGAEAPVSPAAGRVTTPAPAAPASMEMETTAPDAAVPPAAVSPTPVAGVQCAPQGSAASGVASTTSTGPAIAVVSVPEVPDAAHPSSGLTPSATGAGAPVTAQAPTNTTASQDEAAVAAVPATAQRQTNTAGAPAALAPDAAATAASQDGAAVAAAPATAQPQTNDAGVPAPLASGAAAAASKNDAEVAAAPATAQPQTNDAGVPAPLASGSAGVASQGNAEVAAAPALAQPQTNGADAPAPLASGPAGVASQGNAEVAAAPASAQPQTNGADAPAAVTPHAAVPAASEDEAEVGPATAQAQMHTAAPAPQAPQNGAAVNQPVSAPIPVPAPDHAVAPAAKAITPREEAQPEVVPEIRQDTGRRVRPPIGVVPRAGLVRVQFEQAAQPRYTIHLMSSRNKQDLVEFVRAHGLGTTAAYYAVTQQDGVHYRLIYGGFYFMAAARDALENLPQALYGNKPWINNYPTGVQVMQFNGSPVSQSTPARGDFLL